MPNRPLNSIIAVSILIFFSFTLMSLSIKGERFIGIMHRISYTLFSPSRSFFSNIGKDMFDIIQRINALNSAAKENKKLKKEIEYLNYKISKLTEEKIENKRLRRLLGLKRKIHHRVLIASVTAWSPVYYLRSIFIDKGEKDHIRKGMAVITYRGLVGRVKEVYHDRSKVILLTDRGFSIGAMIERSRNTSVLSGSGGSFCYLNYLPLSADIRIGDKVITVGFGGTFPKGIAIGRIVKIKKRPLYITAIVVPYVDLSRLEEVFVILRERSNGT
ncbi:MAG: rod shape-determining protein MreC [Synergistetes bacterium]|nr:rod shape-determining protein MreC [Synergistota bacterium]